MFPRADIGPEHLHSLQASLMLLDYTLSNRALRSLEETLLESEEGVNVKHWVGLECSRGRLVRIFYKYIIGRTVEWDPRIHALYKPLSLSEAGIYEQMDAHSHSCRTFVGAVQALNQLSERKNRLVAPMSEPHSS